MFISKLLNGLSNIDIFGKRVVLNYKENSQIQTSFGGFMVLISILVMVLFFYRRIAEFVSMVNVTVDQTRTYENDPSNVNLTSDIFMFGVNIQQDNFTINPYFNITLQQRVYLKFDNGTRQKNFIDLPLEPCTYNHWAKLNNNTEQIIDDQTFNALNLTTYLCPRKNIKFNCLCKNEYRIDTDLFLGGQIESQVFQHLRILISKCDTNYTNYNGVSNQYWKPTCQSDAAQKDYYTKSIRVQFMISNYIVNPQRPQNLIKRIISNDLFFLIQPTKIYRTADIYFTEYKIQTDESLLPSQQLSYKQFPVQEYGDYREQFTLDNGNFAAFYFNRGKYSQEFFRSYLKLDSLVSQIGGFTQSIFAIATILEDTSKNKGHQRKASAQSSNNNFYGSIQKAFSKFQQQQKQPKSCFYQYNQKQYLAHNDPNSKSKSKSPQSEEIENSRKSELHNQEDINKDLNKNEINSQDQTHAKQIDNQNLQMQDLNIQKENQFLEQKVSNQQSNDQNQYQQHKISQIGDTQIDNQNQFYQQQFKQKKSNSLTVNGKNSLLKEQIVLKKEQSLERVKVESESTQLNQNIYQTPSGITPMISSRQDSQLKINFVDDVILFSLDDSELSPSNQNINNDQSDIKNKQNDLQQPRSSNNQIDYTIDSQKQNNDSYKGSDKIGESENEQTYKQSQNNTFMSSEQQQKQFDFSLPSKNFNYEIQSAQQPQQVYNTHSSGQSPQNQFNQWIKKPISKNNDFRASVTSCEQKKQRKQFNNFEDLYREKMRNQFLKQQLDLQKKQRSKLSLSIKYILYLLTCRKMFKTQENNMLYHCHKMLNKDIDIIFILNKIKEIEKIKYLLLNKEQMTLFNYFPKPLVYIDKNENIELQQQVNEFRDINWSKESVRINQEQSIKRQNQRKKTAFFNININQEKDEMNEMQKLYEAYEKVSNLSEKQRIDKILINMLGNKMKNVFEQSYKIGAGELKDQLDINEQESIYLENQSQLEQQYQYQDKQQPQKESQFKPKSQTVDFNRLQIQKSETNIQYKNNFDKKQQIQSEERNNNAEIQNNNNNQQQVEVNGFMHTVNQFQCTEENDDNTHLNCQ